MSPAHPPRLTGWTVLSLRPRGQHGGLRAACTRLDARLLALSVLAIEYKNDVAARQALATALAADRALFTSPNSVRAAAALLPLRARRGQYWLAVGVGTQRALHRLGIAADAPSRMDSEGLLAMPALASIRGHAIGLVTGSGGRGLLEPALRARGGRVLRADVYAREPSLLAPARLQALHVLCERPRKVLLALTSGEALQGLLLQCTDPRLRNVAVIAASERLAVLAGEVGFTRVATAASARPAALLQAAAKAFD